MVGTGWLAPLMSPACAGRHHRPGMRWRAVFLGALLAEPLHAPMLPESRSSPTPPCSSQSCRQDFSKRPQRHRHPRSAGRVQGSLCSEFKPAKRYLPPPMGQHQPRGHSHSGEEIHVSGPLEWTVIAFSHFPLPCSPFRSLDLGGLWVVPPTWNGNPLAEVLFWVQLDRCGWETLPEPPRRNVFLYCGSAPHQPWGN